jgi:hypothetical protein
VAYRQRGTRPGLMDAPVTVAIADNASLTLANNQVAKLAVEGPSPRLWPTM